VLLADLAATPGTVALCGLGVEVDAFVRGAPARLHEVRWQRLVVVDRVAPSPERLAAVGSTFGVPVEHATAVPSDVAAVVRSPGFLVPAALAAAVPTTNPAALWLAERSLAGGRTVGVTGTKGKSSVTTLLADELRRRGHDVFLGGNVGTALWERAPDTDALVVAELSSYQAVEVDHSPELAAVTLLAEDHLDLHGTVDAYHQAKLNVVCGRARAARAAVVPERDAPLVRARCSAVPLALVPALDDVRRTNAGVVAELLVLLGEEASATPEVVDALVDRYPELPGRFHELTAPTEPVRWVDDALASNAAALVAAVRRARAEHAGRSLVLVVGGRDERGVATGPVVDVLAETETETETATTGEVVVVCFAEFGRRLAADLEAAATPVTVVEVDHLDAALHAAGAQAGAGPATIVFSPGAPTPRDEGSWKDRSARFRRFALGEEVR
jgi:UDP-N-acetylmuramoylalanine-D-glutamate ligase